MSFNTEKIDEIVLAVLYLSAYKITKESEWRAWKGIEWEVLNRLHEKGLISNPKTKAKSIYFSDKGFELANELAEKLFS